MKNKKFYLLCIFSVLLCISSMMTLLCGETSFSSAWMGTLDRMSGFSDRWNPLLDDRLPRLIVLLCTGASLTAAGTVTQALFQNPLASPSVLGIPSGGSLLVVLVFILELHYDFPYAIPLAAFIGCLGALLLVYALSRKKGQVEMTHIILTGIALSTLVMTMQSSLVYAFRDRWHVIQTLTEWEAGSSTDRTWSHVHMQFPLTIFGLIGCWFYSQEINIMACGEEEAKNLGVDIRKVRWRLFLCISLLTSGALAAVGSIAFFGFILPHLIRGFAGPDNRKLIPLSIVAGAAVLTTIDVCLRFFSLHSFSIGNISSIIGAIFFLCILLSNRRNHETVRNQVFNA